MHLQKNNEDNANSEAQKLANNAAIDKLLSKKAKEDWLANWVREFDKDFFRNNRKLSF